MRRLLILSFLSLSLASSALAESENPISSVQRSLKDRGFYHGDAGGRMDDETRSALRRFQIRSALTPTGEINNETLQALAGASPATAPAESATASLRERALQTEISDREFLSHLEASDREAPSTATPPLQSALTTPPEPAPRPAPPPVSAEHREPADGGWTPAKAAEFVRDYLKAAEAPQPDGEIAFFADRVDYFDSGRVTRQFVANDQANYYRRWPKREFSLVGTPSLVSSKGPQATLRFRIRYVVSSARERASGATENVVQVRQESDGPKIISIHERKVRE